MKKAINVSGSVEISRAWSPFFEGLTGSYSILNTSGDVWLVSMQYLALQLRRTCLHAKDMFWWFDVYFCCLTDVLRVCFRSLSSAVLPTLSFLFCGLSMFIHCFRTIDQHWQEGNMCFHLVDMIFMALVLRGSRNGIFFVIAHFYWVTGSYRARSISSWRLSKNTWLLAFQHNQPTD